MGERTKHHAFVQGGGDGACTVCGFPSDDIVHTKTSPRYQR